MPFPVTILGQQFQESDFLGMAYVDGVPDSLSKLAELNAAARSWTSTSSVSIGTGSKVFTIPTSLEDFIVPGESFVRVYNSAGNYMQGLVTAYNSGTGAMTVNVTVAVGAGTFASWTVSLLAYDPSAVATLPVGGDEGGTGRLLNASDVRVGFLKPLPSMGYLMEEEFYPSLPPYDPNITPWIYKTDQEDALSGSSVNNLIGVAQVSYYSGNDACALSLGPSGFLSVGGGGDLAFGAYVAFSTDTFVGQGSTSYFIGLRGEGSSYLSIFDKYGIGFEMILDSTDVRHWYGVVTVAGVTTRQLLVSNVTIAYCSVWVDSFNKVAYLSVRSVYTDIPSPGNAEAYQMSVDITAWPESDPVSFVHPAASVRPNVAAGATSHRMYVDRLFVYKALER